jgi:hypothetical protein
MPIEVWRSRHGDPNATPFVNDHAFPTAIIVIASVNQRKIKSISFLLYSAIKPGMTPPMFFDFSSKFKTKAPVASAVFEVQNKSSSSLCCCVLCIKEKRKGEIRNVLHCAVYEGLDLPLTLPSRYSMVASGGLCFCGGVW